MFPIKSNNSENIYNLNDRLNCRSVIYSENIKQLFEKNAINLNKLFSQAKFKILWQETVKYN